MALTLLILALAVFLGGFCTGILAVFVVSIHRGARTTLLASSRGNRAGRIGRQALTGIRDDAEEGR
jgi:hypothetical protein